MDSCSLSGDKNSCNPLVMSSGSFICSKGICWVPCVGHGPMDPEMEADAGLQ